MPKPAAAAKTRPSKAPALPPGLLVRRVLLEKLVPDAANVRTHDEKNLSAIAGSLRQFGQVEPLIVQKSTQRVIAGNGRMEAMKVLGWKEADVIEVDLTPTQATALAITLNRTGELGGWDFQGLGQILASLKDESFDLGGLGWTDGELSNLLSADWTPPALEAMGEDGEAQTNKGGLTLHLDDDQAKVFLEMVARMRERVGDEAMIEARCLVLLCSNYLKQG